MFILTKEKDQSQKTKKKKNLRKRPKYIYVIFVIWRLDSNSVFLIGSCLILSLSYDIHATTTQNLFFFSLFIF